jgi:hypothetical protein
MNEREYEINSEGIKITDYVQPQRHSEEVFYREEIGAVVWEIIEAWPKIVIRQRGLIL